MPRILCVNLSVLPSNYPFFLYQLYSARNKLRNLVRILIFHNLVISIGLWMSIPCVTYLISYDQFPVILEWVDFSISNSLLWNKIKTKQKQCIFCNIASYLCVPWSKAWMVYKPSHWNINTDPLQQYPMDVLIRGHYFKKWASMPLTSSFGPEKINYCW